MSETKTCPFRFRGLQFVFDDNTVGLESIACLEDKCACWRGMIKTIDTRPDGAEIVTYDNYCGLAGRP